MDTQIHLSNPATSVYWKIISAYIHPLSVYFFKEYSFPFENPGRKCRPKTQPNRTGRGAGKINVQNSLYDCTNLFEKEIGYICMHIFSSLPSCFYSELCLFDRQRRFQVDRIRATSTKGCVGCYGAAAAAADGVSVWGGGPDDDDGQRCHRRKKKKKRWPRELDFQ